MLGYQRQVLESLQQEYAVAQGVVVEQEQVVHGLEERYRTYNDDFCKHKELGMSMMDAMIFENGLRALEIDIKKQVAFLKKLEIIAEKKRQEMIVAKQDTSSAEKLREKKLEAYNKEVQKSEEALIDELVAGTWAMNRDSV